MKSIKQNHFDNISTHYADYAQLASSKLVFKEIDTEFVNSLEGPIVDLGAGTGAFLQHFEFQSGVRKIAVDSNQKMLELISDINITKIISDISKTPLDDHSVNTVLIRQVLQYLSTRQNALKALIEAHRILSEGGWLVSHHMTVPSWDIQFGFSKFMSVEDWPCRFTSVEQHLDDFRTAGFKIEKFDSNSYRRRESVENFAIIRNILKRDIPKICKDAPEGYNVIICPNENFIQYDAQYTFVLAKKDSDE